MSSFLSAIKSLNEAKVRYVVVGGFACVMHGNNRFTADLDVVVDLAPDAARRAIEALLKGGFHSTLGGDPFTFADQAARKKLQTEKKLRVFSLYDPENPTFAVDLFLESPIDFETLYKNAKTIDLKGEKCFICGLDDLIDMKQRAGRPQDNLDLEVLRILKTRVG